MPTRKKQLCYTKISYSYTEIDQQHKEPKREHIEDENRKRRTAEEMHEEALRLRKLYDHFDEYAS